MNFIFDNRIHDPVEREPVGPIIRGNPQHEARRIAKKRWDSGTAGQWDKTGISSRNCREGTDLQVFCDAGALLRIIKV